MTSAMVSGRCLCGAVTYTSKLMSHDVTACHCGMCRRWAGGVGLFVAAEGAPVFQGADNLGIYRSSEWAERGFCKACGSSLYWRFIAKDFYVLSATSLDRGEDLTLVSEIFFDSKPDYYTFANETAKKTGDEVMASFLKNEP